MKTSKLIFAAFLLISPFLMVAQSFVGDWTYKIKTPDGSTITNKISIQADGTMNVDIGNDGTTDIVATYTMDGDKISIKSTNENDPCYNTVGVYQFKIKGNTNTVKAISDPCDARRGDGSAMQMQRVE